MVFSIHRQNRCKALLLALPNHNSAKPGKTMRELLAMLASHYGECKSTKAQVRALQHDLKTLHDENEITCDPASGEGTDLRYRRAPQESLPTGNINLDELYQDLIQRGISADLASELVQRTIGDVAQLPPCFAHPTVPPAPTF